MRLRTKLARLGPALPRVSGFAAVSCLAVLAVTDGLAAYFDPGYSALHDPVSALALSPMGWLQTLGFSIAGGLAMLFVTGFWVTIADGTGIDVAAMLLFLGGIELVLVGNFHFGFGEPWTLASTIHVVDAGLLLGSFPLAAFLLARGLWSRRSWRSVAVYTLVAGCVAAGAGLGRLRPPQDWIWYGLHERVLVGNAAVWIAVMGCTLLRKAQALVCLVR